MQDSTTPAINATETDIKEPVLLTPEQPICIHDAVNSINALILSDKIKLDEREVIKLLRFKNWLLEIKTV